MQAAGAAHILEVALDADDALADQPPVDFQLRFAGAADEAEAAALPLQVGPGPHQPAALIGQGGQLHLQLAFPGARPLAEDLQDQAGAVDDLALPLLLEIALLDRADGGIDHHQLDVILGDQIAIGLHRAAADQGGRTIAGHLHHGGMHHIQADGGGKSHRFRQPALRANDPSPRPGAGPG